MRLAPLLLCLALPLAACSEFPEQGFLTRSLGGTVLDTVPQGSRTARSDVYPAPEPAAAPRRPDMCTEAAHDRADDIKAQGFNQDVQKQVFDATLAECQGWARRH